MNEKIRASYFTLECHRLGRRYTHISNKNKITESAVITYLHNVKIISMFYLFKCGYRINIYIVSEARCIQWHVRQIRLINLWFAIKKKKINKSEACNLRAMDSFSVSVHIKLTSLLQGIAFPLTYAFTYAYRIIFSKGNSYFLWHWLFSSVQRFISTISFRIILGFAMLNRLTFLTPIQNTN